jgi:hypothetical protein
MEMYLLQVPFIRNGFAKKKEQVDYYDPHYQVING